MFGFPVWFPTNRDKELLSWFCLLRSQILRGALRVGAEQTLPPFIRSSRLYLYLPTDNESDQKYYTYLSCSLKQSFCCVGKSVQGKRVKKRSVVDTVQFTASASLRETKASGEPQGSTQVTACTKHEPVSRTKLGVYCHDYHISLSSSGFSFWGVQVLSSRRYFETKNMPVLLRFSFHKMEDFLLRTWRFTNF